MLSGTLCIPGAPAYGTEGSMRKDLDTIARCRNGFLSGSTMLATPSD